MNPNPILGVGFEAFWRGPRLEQLAQTIGAANEAHNGYLEVFLNLGWTGVALLAIIIVVGYRNAFRSFGRNPATGRLWLGYFLAVLLYSFTEAGFRMFSPLWMTFLLAIIGPSATFTNTQATKKLTRKGNGLAEYFTHNMEHKEFGSRQPLTRIPRLSESAEDVLSK
jgi:O-antigen ligase